jgi:hypothetical protein
MEAARTQHPDLRDVPSVPKAALGMVACRLLLEVPYLQKLL